VPAAPRRNRCDPRPITRSGGDPGEGFINSSRQPIPLLVSTTVDWIASHKERLAYALVAVLLLFTVGGGIGAGVLLRHSANIQRQTLRLERLEAAAVRDDPFGAAVAYASVGAHDGAAARRLRPLYSVFLRKRDRGALVRFDARIDDEIQRLARDARATYPVARGVLIGAAVASLLLIAVLIWQFEMQRRAGRIDRDNAERARELARLRDEFVAVVSHELRTPLTSILGFIDLIAEGSRAGSPRISRTTSTSCGATRTGSSIS
jgi:signal transduction histidine kinase